jgi:four helix bundle protein
MTKSTADTTWVPNRSAIRDHRDLVAWQISLQLCLAVYEATRKFPGHERFGLIAELRKTARSVVCNIAEGHERRSRREFIRFVDIAQGSRAELESQLVIASRLGYFSAEDSATLTDLAARVGRLLSALGAKLRRSQVGE